MTYPSGPVARDADGNFFVAGQIGDPFAAHTGGDVPLSAYGRGQELFGGTLDNTDVFFRLLQAAGGGARAPRRK
jgi:alkaline phosphatase